MPSSASKQKQLAEKAAKNSCPAAGDDSPSNSTPASSVDGGSTILTMNGLNSQTGSQEGLLSLAKLNIATEQLCKGATGVLASNPKSGNTKINQYTLSFHGRLLIKGAEIALNYNRRYGLLGENISQKSTFLQSIVERDIEITRHIAIYIGHGEAKPLGVTAVGSIVTSTKAKVARLEAYIEELSVLDDVDEAALNMAQEELDPHHIRDRALSMD